MSDSDTQFMARAIALARRGEGCVEPNPMVGCIVVRHGQIVGQGFHTRFGGPHAEVEALAEAGDAATGATVYVTLEPCAHTGKTPPCSEALTAARPRRVVVAMRDPFPQVDGRGLDALRAAGIEVASGILEDDARSLNAPYLKRVATGKPWVIAKWAMTLDGKIATATGQSKWISGEASRATVHTLRGRVDAILVGRRTAELDDPMLTARPPGPRVATRIVVDTQAQLSLHSKLVCTAADVPVLVAVAGTANQDRCLALEQAGCEVHRCAGGTHQERLTTLLEELGRRQLTNLLVEGGGELLGSFLALDQLDEVHILLAPKLLGGQHAPTPIAGPGIPALADALRLDDTHWQQLGEDLYLTGRVKR